VCEPGKLLVTQPLKLKSDTLTAKTEEIAGRLILLPVFMTAPYVFLIFYWTAS